MLASPARVAAQLKAEDVDVFLKGGAALDVSSARKKPKVRARADSSLPFPRVMEAQNACLIVSNVKALLQPQECKHVSSHCRSGSRTQCGSTCWRWMALTPSAVCRMRWRVVMLPGGPGAAKSRALMSPVDTRAQAPERRTRAMLLISLNQRCWLLLIHVLPVSSPEPPCCMKSTSSDCRYDQEAPERSPVPEYDHRLSKFQRMCIVKACPPYYKLLNPLEAML